MYTIHVQVNTCNIEAGFLGNSHVDVFPWLEQCGRQSLDSYQRILNPVLAELQLAKDVCTHLAAQKNIGSVFPSAAVLGNCIQTLRTNKNVRCVQISYLLKIICVTGN